ncbi:Hsp20/alpha crystallin family protein [Rubinisphaera sp.]|uniref:Hsp20/alpha crystallin family protein n=1 Tax=Rubinisphaera sp. TaxID=2024857 RepID=UPI000C10C223|nr:Hsp20/alpha crystallin family protein [Rubinisphaera sp.]MBV12287.1 heat-shock protein Hsp20 [Rubinisphaera sp.]|tara:strand:+ start:7816 stop:8256 length:441 start_codon:yes stop_codon:yes gene_type:complete
MPVFRWGNAWGSMQEFEREMDRLLQSMNITMRSARSARSFPAVNFYEHEDKFLMTAEIPGVQPEDLELSISSGVLNIKGKRQLEPAIPQDQFRRQERMQGSWERSLSLPERVNEEGLEAELKDGVLTITLPRAPQVAPRQIPVITS